MDSLDKDLKDNLNIELRNFNELSLNTLHTLFTLVTSLNANFGLFFEHTPEVFSPRANIKNESFCYFKEYKIKGSTLWKELLQNNNPSFSSFELTLEEQKAFIFDCLQKSFELDIIKIINEKDMKDIYSCLTYSKLKLPLSAVDLNKMPNKVVIVKSLHSYWIPRVLTELITIDVDVAMPTEDTLFNEIVAESAKENAIKSSKLDAFTHYLQVRLNKGK